MSTTQRRHQSPLPRVEAVSNLERHGAAASKALSAKEALRHPIEAARHGMERLVEAGSHVAPNANPIGANPIGAALGTGLAAMGNAATEVEHAAEKWIREHMPNRGAKAEAANKAAAAATGSKKKDKKAAALSAQATPGARRRAAAVDGVTTVVIQLRSLAQNAIASARGGALPAPVAAACGVLCVALMHMLNTSAVHSDLHWVYRYLPAGLAHALQPQMHVPILTGPAAWASSLLKGATGALQSNERWFHSLAAPSWAAPDVVHRAAWQGVHLAIGYAVFRLLAAPRTAAPTSAKAFVGFLMTVAALRSSMWGYFVLGMRSLPLGVFHYATFVALMMVAAAKTSRFDKRAGAALAAANVWVAYTCAQFAAMAFMNRA